MPYKFEEDHDEDDKCHWQKSLINYDTTRCVRRLRTSESFTDHDAAGAGTAVTHEF